MKEAYIGNCPFCGKNVKRVHISCDEWIGHIRCKCGARSPFVEMNNREFNSGMTREQLALKVIDAWNNRPTVEAEWTKFQIYIDIE